MFRADEFIVLAEHDGDGDADPGEIVGAIVRLGLHHARDIRDKGVECVRGCGKAFIVQPVPAEAPVERWRWLEVERAARIHVAGEEEDAAHSSGMLVGKDKRGAGTVAPADEAGFLDAESIHHSQYVIGHAAIAERPVVAGAAAVSPAVDDDDGVTRGNQRRSLMAPVPGIAQPAMQQNDGRAGAIDGMPDVGAVILDISFRGCGWQWRCAIPFEAHKVVIRCLHGLPPVFHQGRAGGAPSDMIG